MVSQEEEEEYQDAVDNNRVGTPDVDTSIPFTNAFSMSDLLFLVPPIAAAFAPGLLLYVVGYSFWLLIASMIASAVLTVFFTGLVLSSHEFTNPKEVAAGWISYFSTRILMPVSDPLAAYLRLHGVRRGFANGSIEMDDYSLVMLRRMDGRTTQNLDQEEFDRIGARFGTNIDEGIRDFRFKFFTQSSPHDIEEIVGEWEDLAYSGVLDRMKGYMGEVMRSRIEWLRDVDAPSENAQEVNDYIAIRVRPKDIQGYNPETDSDSSSRTSILERIGGVFLWPLSKANPFDGHSKFWTDGSGWFGKNDEDEPPLWVKKEVQKELDRRVKKVDRNLLAGIPGTEVREVSIEEHAAVLLSYWTGKNHTPDEDFERKWNELDDIDSALPTTWPSARLYRAGDKENGVEDPENVPGSDAARQALQTAVPSADREDVMAGSDADLIPSHFDQKKGYMEVGDQLVSCYWIANHRTTVQAGFAKGLYQLSDVSFTVTWDVTPVKKEQAISEVKDAEKNTGAKAIDESEIESRDTISKKRILGDVLDRLQNSTAQAWDISGYVTLRVGPEQALQFANREENENTEFEDEEDKKMSALLAAQEQLEEIVEGSPFNGRVIKPLRWQRQLLESASPNKGNVYNDMQLEDGDDKGKIMRHLEVILGDEETSGPKQRRVLGGWLGALFPPCMDTINEDGGMYWGRDTETGLPFRTNPADRDTGGHMMTAGITRSGKTYGGEAALTPWFIEGILPLLKQYIEENPNRKFVACDTQRGFLALCKLLGGKHIPIDGDTRLNPFDGRPSLDSEDDNEAYRLSVDFVVEFIKRILRAQGTTADRYHSVIELGVEANYERAGMATGRFVPDSDKEMPTMDSALEVWKDMQSDASPFSHSGPGSTEVEKKEELAGELLNHLSGFRPGGKYENLLGHTNFTFDTEDGETPFYYLDMFGLTTSKDAEKSAMLWLGTNFTTQLSRESDDEMVYLGDEAHLMLYSDEQVEMLLRWLREWARNNSWVWLISQNLSEYMVSNTSNDGGKKQAMIDQFAQKQLYKMPTENETPLRKFLDNDMLFDMVQDDLTPALAERGFSEFIMKVEDNDKPGWHRVKVETDPLMNHSLNYDPKADYSFDEYIQWFLHTDALAPIERLFADEEDLEKEPEITDKRGLADLYAQRQRMDRENGSDAETETEDETEPEPEATDEPETAGPKRDAQGRFVSQEADD